MTPDENTHHADSTADPTVIEETQRRMTAAEGYATPPPSRRDTLYSDNESALAPAPPSRRSSVYENGNETTEEHDTATTRQPSMVANALNEQPPQSDAYGPQHSQRKRTERHHGCETMFSMDQIFSRDLRITGVSKKGSSWRYHIEVLDIRGSLMPFTDTFTSTSTTTPTIATTTTTSITTGSLSSPANSPASSSIASLSSLSYPNDSHAPAPSSLPPVVRYSVMRRYNDFRQLYLYLLDTYPTDVLEDLPKFPDGGLFSYFRGDDPKLLQFRKEQLQRFLRALDANEDTKWSRAFRFFLNPEIEELTTIGGSFASSVDAAPSSVSSSSWAGMGLSRINTESGYVSLSYVKSPEIRFKKQPSDGRGDWKRRKMNHRDEDDHAMTGTKSKSRAKRLDMEPERDHSDTGDEDEEVDDDDDASRKPCTELMKLLSLEPPVEE